MLPDNEYYHRSSVDFIVDESVGFKKKISTLCFQENQRKEKEEVFGRVWNIYNFLVNYDVDDFLLASDLDAKGKGALTVGVSLLRKKGFYCDLPLIKDGIILNMGNEGLKEQVRYTAVSDFIIPETVYNPFGINPKLPDIVTNEETKSSLKYLVMLSERQTKPDCYYSKSDVSNLIISLNNNKKALLINPKEENASGSPIPLKMMIDSSTYSQRISTEPFFLKKGLKKNLKSPIIEELKPFPLNETQMNTYFRLILERELFDFCSYAYKDDQFKFFTSGTNHVINGKIVGGFNVAMYYDDVIEIKREMLERNPNVHVKNATFLLYMVFASLYPPDDEMNFKKYGVCVNPLRYSTVFREWDMFCDCSNDLFKVYPDKDSEDYKRSYCTFSVPFDCLANECIPTFVRYLPFEGPNKEVLWKDVLEEEGNVYTQVRMFVSNTVRIEDLASTLPRLEHSKVMIGCPNIDGSLLEEYSVLVLPRMLGIYTNSDVFERYVLGEGETLLYNIYCCAQSLRCTPTDFIVSKEQDKKKKDYYGLYKKKSPITQQLAILRYQEIVHKIQFQ